MSVQRAFGTASAANRQILSPILNSTGIPEFPSPFSTPRRRKKAQNNSATQSPSKTWPRIGRKVPSETLEDVTKQIFGYSPRRWQTKVAEKVLEGNDAIVIAGTGAGKSLVFAMLAVAAELAGFEGVVIVICPLKSLQKDQVRFF
jgi:superfamily II DNA helicase RecQ